MKEIRTLVIEDSFKGDKLFELTEEIYFEGKIRKLSSSNLYSIKIKGAILDSMEYFFEVFENPQGIISELIIKKVLLNQEEYGYQTNSKEIAEYLTELKMEGKIIFKEDRWALVRN